MLALANVLIAGGPAGAADHLDASMGKLLRQRGSCAKVESQFAASSRRLFDVPIETAPIRFFLTNDFFAEVNRWSETDREEFVSCMGRLGFPYDLNPIELDLLAANPNHPLFKPLSELAMPKGFGRALGYRDRVYSVLDVVRSFRTARRWTKRKPFAALRTAVESELKQSLDTLPLDAKGHLTASIVKRADLADVEMKQLLDRPLTEVLRARVTKDLAGDEHVLSRLNKLMADSGQPSIHEKPARYFMTAEYYRYTSAWNNLLRQQFRHLMMRAGLPTNLDAGELETFEREPSNPLFSPITAVSEFAHSQNMNKKAEIGFVIDAVKALQSPKDHPFKGGRRVEKQAAIERYLGGPAGAPKECQRLLHLSDAELMAELQRVLAEVQRRLFRRQEP